MGQARAVAEMASLKMAAQHHSQRHHHRVKSSMGYWLVLILGLSLGSLLSGIGRNESVTDLFHPPELLSEDSLALQRQTAVQQKFQLMVQSTQFPQDCRKARILYKDKEAIQFDGFANEVQFMVRYLQIAVATGRVLVVSSKFTSAYAPATGCNAGPASGLACLWTPVSNCTKIENKRGMARVDVLPQPLGVGILSSNNASVYFDASFYGPKRIVRVEKFVHLDGAKLVDVIPHWERQFGRFWIRSQMAHYFWQHQTSYLQKELQSRLPRTLLDRNEPYIAFHIRMTDNVGDFARDFGRNATVTRQFGRFMGIADSIRLDNPKLRHIYVATDNKDIAAATKSNKYPQWKFYMQKDVKRARSDSEFLWFRDHRSKGTGGVAADIETLRRADFLVGSFQSNVYRLAAELNICYHASKYLWNGAKRIFAVDVEWYEDP